LEVPEAISYDGAAYVPRRHAVSRTAGCGQESTVSPLIHESDRLSPDDRRGRGRAARERVPVGSLGGWPPSERRHDALSTILAQNDRRISEFVPLRHGRMSASPWSYFRGAAAVMAADLASGPNTGIEVQLCGDAHVLNFGLWATPERNLSFDLRDFDETLPGPFEWDVQRLAASLVVVARHNGLAKEIGDDAVAAALLAYRTRIAHYATAPQMEIWYDSIYVDQLLGYFGEKRRKRVSKLIDKQGQRRTSRGAFEKLTAMVDGRRRIMEDPPKLTHFDDPHRLEIVRDVLEKYVSTIQDDRRHCLANFSYVDVARQVVGVGSVGLRVHLILLEGRGGGDPLFLQVKQAVPSVYEAHLRRSRYRNHGARVVNGKRLIQSATDIFVGWTSMEGLDFYVRQFRDMKVIPDAERIAPGLVEFAAACGEVLARSHARTGDPVAIDGYIGKGGKFDEAIGAYARAYADQTEQDHAQLAAAISRGALPVERD
jgi:uncharacterized protein (DUF2252 family)